MVEAEAVCRCLDELMMSMGSCFRRWEPRLQARKLCRAKTHRPVLTWAFT
jgi:hypothetical protein